jgi:hypothetical protein
MERQAFAYLRRLELDISMVPGQRGVQMSASRISGDGGSVEGDFSDAELWSGATRKYYGNLSWSYAFFVKRFFTHTEAELLSRVRHLRAKGAKNAFTEEELADVDPNRHNGSLNMKVHFHAEPYIWLREQRFLQKELGVGTAFENGRSYDYFSASYGWIPKAIRDAILLHGLQQFVRARVATDLLDAQMVQLENSQIEKVATTELLEGQLGRIPRLNPRFKKASWLLSKTIVEQPLMFHEAFGFLKIALFTNEVGVELENLKDYNANKMRFNGNEMCVVTQP